MNIVGTIYGRGKSIVQNRIAVAGPSLPSNLELWSNLVHAPPNHREVGQQFWGLGWSTG